MTETWHGQLEGLEAWLDEVDTDPDITSCIMQTLLSRNPATRFSDSAAPHLLTTAQSQDLIGWSNMLEGRISAEWSRRQRIWYLSHGSDRCPDQWAKGLVLNLLMISHELWLQRNKIVHERHANGLLLAEAARVRWAIQDEFDLGGDDLFEEDQWLLELGLDHVLGLSGHDQENWLTDIRLAREEFAEGLAYDAMEAD